MSIGLIVLALAFVFFLVVAYFAAQTWHWGHVVAMSFLFLFSLLFLYMASTLLRTHNKFRPAYERAVSDYEQQLKQTEQLTYGAPAKPAAEGTLFGERRLAKSQQASAPRRWSNVIAAQFTPQGITLNMRPWTNEGCQKVGQESEDSNDPIEPEPDPALAGDEEGGAPVEVGGHGIKQDQYLYVFQTFPVREMTAAEKSFYFGSENLNGAEFVDGDSKNLCRVPGAYLGKFIVTDSKPDRVTIKEAGELTNTQRALIGKKPNIWMLFEKLPADTNELFAGLPAEERAKLLPMLMPIERFARRGIPINPAIHQTMLSEYLRDGQPVEGRVSSPFRVQQTVKFVKDFEMLVDFEAEDLNTTSPYSSDGRAQVKSLMQGGPVQFTEGQEITVDGAFADRLVRDGFATKEGSPTYSRQLKDYQFLMNDFQNQLNEVASQRNVVQDQVDDLDASLRRLVEQLDKHVEELKLLEEDKKGFEIETEKLKEFKKILTERLAILRGEVETRSFASR